MAAWMLRNGDEVDRVAAATDVPFALVELIAEHLPPRAATRPRSPGRPTDPASPAAGLDIGAGLPVPSGDAATAVNKVRARRRRVRRILRVAVICAVLNAVLSVAAVLVHADTVAAVCLTLMPLSYAVVLALQLLLPPPTRPRHRRR